MTNSQTVLSARVLLVWACQAVLFAYAHPAAAAVGHAVAGTAEAGARPPNLLFLFPDQWRSDWDGITFPQEKLPLKMPTVQRLAAHGVRFTQAYVPAPVCAPSRACLASGREYDRTLVPNNGWDYAVANYTTIYSRLREVGYHTITVGKDDLTKGSDLGYTLRYPGCPQCKDGDGLYHQSELGFDDGLRYGGKHDIVKRELPHEMFGFYLRNHTVTSESGVKQSAWDAHRKCMQKKGISKEAACDSLTFTSEFYEDDWTATNAIKLLQRRPKDKPFFLQVNFPGPHDPFLITAKMRKSVSDGRIWPEATDDTEGDSPGGACKAKGEPNPKHDRCNYAAELENLDQKFQDILDVIEEQGELDRTIVFVSSDHGEMLGDHGLEGKTVPWKGSVAVPLIVQGPGIAAGHIVPHPVATLDLGGTFLDFAGTTPATSMSTKSLRGMLQAASSDGEQTRILSPPRPFVASGLENWRMVVQELNGTSYKYICCKGACPGNQRSAPPVSKSGWTQMLINVRSDPFDMHDLSLKMPEIASALRALLPTDAYQGVDYRSGCATISSEPSELEVFV